VPRPRRRLTRTQSTQFSRRDFIRTCVGGTGTLLLSDPTKAADLGARLPSHRFSVRRDSDLLDLEFTFVNFTATGERLVALGGGSRSSS
jgi:hypothetical protein